MANKTIKSKKKFDQQAVAPTTSPGSYYVRVSRKKWYVMIETWSGGIRKQKSVSPGVFNELGFVKTMTVEQAKLRVKEINKLGKTEKIEYRAKVFSEKRAERQKAIDKIYFPPEVVEKFLESIYESPGMKKKYQNRVVRCFEVVTEMIPKHVKILPHQYNTEINKIVNYFCSQQYSISYSSDIIMLMNMWAKCYAKHKGVYADLIEKLSNKNREAIHDAHINKKQAVRKRALPITRLDLENCYSMIDKSNEEEMSFFRWTRASWLFGLRPSELDRFIANDQEEDRTEYNEEKGVNCLVVKQTKTVSKSGLRLSYKRIPVLSHEQEEALEDILTKPTKRPTPEWMDKHLRRKNIKYKPLGLKFDCYSGRKGYIDLMLSDPYNQKLENISVYLGHASVVTSYTHYKDRENVHYDPTPYNKKNKKPLKLVG